MITGGVTTVRVNFWVAVVPVLSVTVTVKLPVAVAVGLPVIAPEALNESPANGAGKGPAGDHV